MAPFCFDAPNPGVFTGDGGDNKDFLEGAFLDSSYLLLISVINVIPG